MLTIGTLTLDNDPYVKTDYDYKTSSNGTIIGGLKTIVLSGTIVEDNPSSVLSTAKSISDWYATSTDRYYKNITINGIAYQQIKIEDVQISSVDDWVNTVDYSITIIASIESTSVLPSNSLGLDYSDYISGLDIEETLNIDPASQGGFIVAGGALRTVKDSVKWSSSITVTGIRTADHTAIKKATDFLQQVLIATPERAEFNQYKTWNLYIQQRNIDMNSVEGTVTLNIDALLIHPQYNASALVTISGSTSHTYSSNSHTASVNINCNGLISIPWSKIIAIESSCLSGKYENAKTTAVALTNIYRNFNNFPTNDLLLEQLECSIPCNLGEQNICYIPKTFTFNKNATEGSVDVTLEWSSEATNCNSDGYSVEIQEDANSSEATIVEFSNFWVPAPIVQNVNCNKSPTRNYTVNVSSKFKCPNPVLYDAAWAAYNNTVLSRVGSLSGNWAEIGKSATLNNTSYTITSNWIQSCQ